MATTVWRPLEPRWTGPGGTASSLPLEGALEGELNVIADGRDIRADSELAALDRGRCLKTHRVRLIDGIHARADEVSVQHYRLRNAVKRQVSRDRGLTVAARDHLRGGEDRRREFLRVEPLRALQLVGEFRNRRRDRLYRDRDVELRRRQMCGIELQAAGHAGKQARIVSESE